MVIHVTITEYDNLYVCEHKKKREKKSQNKNFQSLLENNS